MEADQPVKIAAQLYTFRDHVGTPEEFRQTLSKIKEIGCDAVQISAVPWLSVDDPIAPANDAKAILDDLGMRCIATHRDWKSVRDTTEQEIKFHKILDCSYTALGWIASDFEKSAEGTRQFVKESKPVIAAFKEAGIQFGIHNHAYEFARQPGTRKTLYDIFIDEGGDDLMLELDTAWAWHGGVDPVKLLNRSHGRVPVIHVKDLEVADQLPIVAPVGEGNLDWPPILAAAKTAGTEWLAIEQDECRRDVFDCFRSSVQYLQSLGAE
jgi:sugar phosphate isomerase/epimerase